MNEEVIKTSLKRSMELGYNACRKGVPLDKVLGFTLEVAVAIIMEDLEGYKKPKVNMDRDRT